MSSKNEAKIYDVKIYNIREELSLALNQWQKIEVDQVESRDTKNSSSVPVKPQPSLSSSPRKKKLLKEIKQQLESL